MIKAILVDDHALFRLGVKSAIASDHKDICIIGEADSRSALFRLLETVTPDIILLDIILPDTSGVEIACKNVCLFTQKEMTKDGCRTCCIA